MSCFRCATALNLLELSTLDTSLWRLGRAAVHLEARELSRARTTRALTLAGILKMNILNIPSAGMSIRLADTSIDGAA